MGFRENFVLFRVFVRAKAAADQGCFSWLRVKYYDGCFQGDRKSAPQ